MTGVLLGRCAGGAEVIKVALAIDDYCDGAFVSEFVVWCRSVCVKNEPM